MFPLKRWTKSVDSSQKRLWASCLLLLFTSCLSGCMNRSVRESWDFDGLRLTLSSPKFHYEIGEEVTITARVENTTQETILWESAKTANPEYVFEVFVDGMALSSLYQELQVSSRELKPGEKIEIEYTFLPEKQESSYVFVDVNIYYDQGARATKSINLEYGVMAK
jgi:hypothetical protein